MTSRDSLSNAFLDSDTVSDDLFVSIVENKLDIKRDAFQLRLVLLSSAAGKNDNYQSVVYRAKIKIEVLASKERKSIDVIVKALLLTMPEFKKMSVFPRERNVYEDILGSFETIWLERAGVEIKFGPRSIKFETDPYEIIVLDDLKAEGFEMLDRRVGMNMKQAELVLTKLAKYHAAGAARYQKDGIINPELFDRKAVMTAMMSNPQDNPMMGALLGMFGAFVQAVQGYEGCEVQAEKICRWDAMKLFSQFIIMADPMPCEFQVLTHGDLWINNILFKSDDKDNLLDVSFIDYQNPFWGSPASDLIYFLVTSIADDIRVDHFDEFVEFYHRQLTSSLATLKYSKYVPTLEELNIDLAAKGAFGCICLIFTLSGAKNDSHEEFNMEALIAGNQTEMLTRLYQNEAYKKSVTALLKFFDERGFLDMLLKTSQ